MWPASCRVFSIGSLPPPSHHHQHLGTTSTTTIMVDFSNTIVAMFQIGRLLYRRYHDLEATFVFSLTYIVDTA